MNLTLEKVEQSECTMVIEPDFSGQDVEVINRELAKLFMGLALAITHGCKVNINNPRRIEVTKKWG